MQLSLRKCPDSSAIEVLDLDRGTPDPGDPQPLIVARVYEEGLARAILALPGLIVGATEASAMLTGSMVAGALPVGDGVGRVVRRLCDALAQARTARFTSAAAPAAPPCAPPAQASAPTASRELYLAALEAHRLLAGLCAAMVDPKPDNPIIAMERRLADALWESLHFDGPDAALPAAVKAYLDKLERTGREVILSSDSVEGCGEPSYMICAVRGPRTLLFAEALRRATADLEAAAAPPAPANKG